MYYNRSCRACGTHLEPTSICSICKEDVSWICGKCFKLDDVTHRHTYYRIPYMVEVAIVTSYKQEKTKNKMGIYPFLQNNTETEIFRQTS
jgi:predicted amidophosphoribosyltransferase